MRVKRTSHRIGPPRMFHTILWGETHYIVAKSDGQAKAVSMRSVIDIYSGSPTFNRHEVFREMRCRRAPKFDPYINLLKTERGYTLEQLIEIIETIHPHKKEPT